jgi:hypothetical protein
VRPMADVPKQRLLGLLTRGLVPFFTRGYLVVFGLLGAAIVTGLLGLPLVAYFCFCALVLGVGSFFAGSGLWVVLFAFVLFQRRLKEKQTASAYSGLVIFLAAGLFLVYCGVAAIWGFFSHWPYGYWPSGNVPGP